MGVMTTIGRRRLLQLGSSTGIALLAAGCTAPPPDPTPAPSPSRREPQVSIVQGTVGSLGSARVGYVNRAAELDRVSIWRDGDDSGFGSSVGLREGDWAFIGGECWALSRLASSAGRTRIGFDPVLTRVPSPAPDAGLIYSGLGTGDTSASARIGTGNRMAVVELAADSAVLRHWPGLSSPDDPGRLVPVRIGSRLVLGRVTLTVTAFRPPLDRLRGYLVVRLQTSSASPSAR